MPRVLVVGSANVDYTVALRRLPQPGETVSGGSLLVNRGGKGANQAVAARRLGADVRFVACVGADAAGAEMRTALGSEGIGVGGVTAVDGAATGTALIVVDAEGRNQIAVAPGANQALSIAHVAARRDDFAWADVVVCQLETPLPAVRAALEAACRSGAATVVNPAPVPDTSLDFLDLVDYLTPNAGEARRLAGVDGDPRRAAEALRARGVGVAVVTLGEAGVLAAAPGGVMTVPAFPVTAVDTTAAGDAFNGALAVALARRRALADALRFASAAAALACTRRGAQASLPQLSEVDRLLATEPEPRSG